MKKAKNTKKNKKTPSFFDQFLYATLFLFFLIIFLGYLNSDSDVADTTIPQFINDLENGKVESVVIENNTVNILYTNDTKGELMKEPNVAFSETLVNYGLSPDDLKGLSLTIEDGRNFLYYVAVIFPFLIPAFDSWYFCMVSFSVTQSQWVGKCLILVNHKHGLLMIRM